MMLRVVLDTNIYVSKVLIPSGLPAQAYRAWQDAQFELLTSPAILHELRNTLGYERIRRKYHITDGIVDELIGLLERHATVVVGTADVTGAIPADPSDEIVLACAVDGQADLIVSGDQHLLALASYHGIPIIPVRAFLARLALT
ncbi:MAG: putative toxin-antitoxin system toxin component, PIN family [Chloroflexi bacterium]|nr:MAG: putative toxin-antitoxin system toxin component, PIN family [Chloroflexota bacterium]